MTGSTDGSTDGPDGLAGGLAGLAGLLAGERPAGVYHWRDDAGLRAGEPGDVGDTVTGAGWGFAHLDGRAVASRRDLLAVLGAVLDFPDHYGRNLDALADCLYDVPRTLLLWDGWAPVARAEPWAFGAVTRVLADRALDVRLEPFAVLLRGDGPSDLLPDLR